MSNDKLVCPVCGEPTRVYMGNARKDRLCGKHADMLKSGELELNQFGRFVLSADKSKEISTPSVTTENSSTVCIICGAESSGKDICKACYSEVMNIQKELDKNKKKFDAVSSNSLDSLIRNKLITDSVATSIMNDNALSLSIAKSLRHAAEIISGNEDPYHKH